MVIDIKLEKGGILPAPATEHAGALDCCALLEGGTESVTIGAGAHRVISLGFSVEVPVGYRLRLVGRSGMASRNQRVHPGIIDADYRGVVKAIVYNDSKCGEDLVINQGDRIAQCYIEEIIPIKWNSVSALSATARGTGGFGSTGV